ncbi:MAG: hypothetical protein INR73_28745 [Williamsia sp.]|nr:hypothetical protein [Williamsia sp.]
MSAKKNEAYANQATISQEIDELNRELGLRKGYYPKAISLNKLTQAQADEQVRILTSGKHRLASMRMIQARLTPGQANILNAMFAYFGPELEQAWTYLMRNPEIAYEALPTHATTAS